MAGAAGDTYMATSIAEDVPRRARLPAPSSDSGANRSSSMLQRSFVQRHANGEVDDSAFLTLNHIAQTFAGGVIQVAAESSGDVVDKRDVRRALEALGHSAVEAPEPEADAPLRAVFCVDDPATSR